MEGPARPRSASCSSLSAVIGLAIPCYVARRPAAARRSSTALLIAAAGFGAAYFTQAKGLHYHSIPLVGCGAIALAVFLAKDNEPPRLLGILAPVLLSLPLILSWLEARSPRLPDADLNRAIAGLPPGANVGFLATEPAFAFSVTLQHGFGDPPRYFGFWMMRRSSTMSATAARSARPPSAIASAAILRMVSCAYRRCGSLPTDRRQRGRPPAISTSLPGSTVQRVNFAALMTYYRGCVAHQRRYL